MERVDIKIRLEPELYRVGTEFDYRPGSSSTYKASIIGYHVSYDTDTKEANISYRIQYVFAGQLMRTNCPRATVARAMLKS